MTSQHRMIRTTLQLSRNWLGVLMTRSLVWPQTLGPTKPRIQSQQLRKHSLAKPSRERLSLTSRKPSKEAARQREMLSGQRCLLTSRQRQEKDRKSSRASKSWTCLSRNERKASRLQLIKPVKRKSIGKRWLKRRRSAPSLKLR